jgi:hypothetical protein
MPDTDKYTKALPIQLTAIVFLANRQHITLAAIIGLQRRQNTVFLTQSVEYIEGSQEVGKQRQTKIFVATPSHRFYVPQGNDLFLTWDDVLIKCS